MECGFGFVEIGSVTPGIIDFKEGLIVMMDTVCDFAMSYSAVLCCAVGGVDTSYI